MDSNDTGSFRDKLTAIRMEDPIFRDYDHDYWHVGVICRSRKSEPKYTIFRRPRSTGADVDMSEILTDPSDKTRIPGKALTRDQVVDKLVRLARKSGFVKVKYK